MQTFERGTIVRVPFPYTDRALQQRRPAFVVSPGTLGDRQQLIWVMMITSAENRRWSEDIDFGQTYVAAGLPAPSVVRAAKIATIEKSLAEPLGKADDAIIAMVEQTLLKQLGLTP